MFSLGRNFYTHEDVFFSGVLLLFVCPKAIFWCVSWFSLSLCYCFIVARLAFFVIFYIKWINYILLDFFPFDFGSNGKFSSYFCLHKDAGTSYTHTHSNKFVSFSIQKCTKKKLSHTPFAVYKTYVFHSGSHSLDDLLSSSRMVWKLYIYSPSCLPFCLRCYTLQNQSIVLSIVFGFWCLRNLSDFMWKRTHPPKIQFNSYFHLVLASQVRRERVSFYRKTASLAPKANNFFDV